MLLSDIKKKPKFNKSGYCTCNYNVNNNLSNLSLAPKYNKLSVSDNHDGGSNTSIAASTVHSEIGKNNNSSVSVFSCPGAIYNDVCDSCSNGYYGLNLSNQGLRSISSSLYYMRFLKELYLENNQITSISEEICNLKELRVLNVSNNRLKIIPSSISKLLSLRYLILNNNFISSVPVELGTLYNLVQFELDGNPLVEPFCKIRLEKNGLGIIKFCRENNTNYKEPIDRAWIDVCNSESGDVLSVGSYNILCPHYTKKEKEGKSIYGYVPSWILHWDNRSEMVLNDLLFYNLDILALQEMETYSFMEKFRDTLETKLNYDSLFYPKNRSIGMNENERLKVDGCATFWKKQKYRLVYNQYIEFNKIIMTDNRFKNNDDIINRNINRDNIALVTVLERVRNGNGKDGVFRLIVVNTHLYWDPRSPDIKLIQTILLLEEIEKIKSKYNGYVILCGDFNSERNSAVYNLIINKKIEIKKEFLGYDYSALYDFKNNIKLMDSYKDYEIDFTSFTPEHKGVLDYIFHEKEMEVRSLLSGVDEEYAGNVIGFPNLHYPSDHIIIGIKFNIKK
ncbi:glucose-repressible alcohol dehydrogenase transcriptional effector [Spraguea lophii 42_110]|uniref:poly(A)-specific ribonuclease n=1 Tax=Spraguea lophii (strain 42_110) TaxID=1358809 RepID=S7XT06_SPRLO|nr:glucose-repressible alcohol dehydrogenase transcriptional effector [Spraguea lophii 42_110]